MGILIGAVALMGTVSLPRWEESTNAVLRLQSEPGKSITVASCTEKVAFEQGAEYVYSVDYRGEGCGTLLLGVGPYGHCFLFGKGAEWRTARMMFRTPEELAGKSEKLHVKPYGYTGWAEFRNPTLVKVEPRYAKSGGETLGFGEAFEGDVYTFTLPFSRKGGHYSCRSLERISRVKDNFASAFFFHSKRGEVVYRHRLENHAFESADFHVIAEKCTSGTIELSVSKDGVKWTKAGEIVNGKLDLKGTFPAGMFPAKEFFVKFADKPGERPYVIVESYAMTANVSGPPLFAQGGTRYVEAATGCDLPKLARETASSARFGEKVLAVPGLDIWRASSGWRIFRDMPVPEKSAAALEIKAAANEAESAQLVVRPEMALNDVRLAATELKDGKGNAIPASAIDVRYVHYVNVTTPSDGVGFRGLWPDPLPPLPKSPFPVEANANQPFWITVKPPKGTPRGVYRGVIIAEIKPSDQQTIRHVQVPLEVEVFGFDLPDEMTCKTVFGYGGGDKTTWRYHNAKTEAEKKRVRDLYLRMHSDYHLGLREGDQLVIPCKWVGKDRKNAMPVFDFSNFDAMMEEAVGTYHFNMRRLYPEGLGSQENSNLKLKGKENLIHGPLVNGVKLEENPEAYHRLMGRYFKALENHLREKGWIDNVYVHWYDEPRPEDYPALKRGFGIMRRHAPWLKKLLTEQPEKELLGEADIWCPLIDMMHSKCYPEARAAGDGFWWYICNWPREPYVTDCIDHPAVELRTWLWQTWGENVTGIDYWLTVNWTSPAVYKDPKHPQNPYEDPMSWRWDEKRGGFWGNGEANLFFPPVDCANKTAAGEDFPAVTGEGPVPTIRVAMLRDGLEDYEYFAMLRKRNPNHPFLKVPTTVYTSLTDFSTDPVGIEEHRLKLAREIEKTK